MQMTICCSRVHSCSPCRIGTGLHSASPAWGLGNIFVATGRHVGETASGGLLLSSPSLFTDRKLTSGSSMFALHLPGRIIAFTSCLLISGLFVKLWLYSEITFHVPHSALVCLTCQSESGWTELRGLTGLQKLLFGLSDVWSNGGWRGQTC